ncbi:MAG: DUF4350 domain-containing protein [Pirellulaceae bacterium]
MSVAVTSSRFSVAAHRGVAWGIALGLLAAWLAAGSLGLLAASLQAALVWLMLAVAVLCARPRFTPVAWLILAVQFAALAVLPLAVAPVRLGLTLTVAATLGWLAVGLAGVERRLMLIGSLSVVTLVLYRFAQQSIPAVWMLSDSLGVELGRMTGTVLDRPLAIGASFAGLDFLIVLFAFGAGWVTLLRRPRWSSVVFAVLAVCAVHFAYLMILTFTHDMAAALPLAAEPGVSSPYVPPPFSWLVIVRQLLPWNLPVLAALLHTALVVVLVRSGTYEPRVGQETSGSGSREWRHSAAAIFALGCLAGIVPLVGTLRMVHGLDGKKIVANAHGQMDWERPQHGRYGLDTAGMYGMLPALVESLGGNLTVSSELSATDLESADVLMILHPDASLAAQQQQRIWQYVRAGGSLLVVTEGFAPENGLDRRDNELLQATEISVNRDAAVSETRDWWGALLATDHPATTSAYPHTTRIVSDRGASLQVGWPARPLLVGVWGWSAPEQEPTGEDSQEFQEGSRLGDLVLAAEQRVGAGRVVVLGDNACLTNEGLVDGHRFVGHLLSYLAVPSAGPQAAWRQVALVASMASLLVWLACCMSPGRLAVSCVLLAISLACCQKINCDLSGVIPDGSKITSLGPGGPTNRLAYIDATHLEPNTVQAWEFDALNGLALNLQRNGYLPLRLHDLLGARLERASLLISIGPARRFSSAEREQIRQFVERGGSLISTVGAEESAPSAPLLAEFGLRVPASPVPTAGDWLEPEPFGRTKASYLEVAEDSQPPYQAAVRFHAAWPVETIEPPDQETEVLVYGRNTLPVVESEAELPVILLRMVGQGLVVLIGDTAFAMNKNLEYIGGEPFYGGHENAHFWRWLLTQLRGEPAWIPPRPPERVQDSHKADDTEADGDDTEADDTEAPEEES